MNLNKEPKLEYVSNYDCTNNDSFWANCKPFFTNKHSGADTDILLGENGKLTLKKQLRTLLMIILDPL